MAFAADREEEENLHFPHCRQSIEDVELKIKKASTNVNKAIDNVWRHKLIEP